jgi:ATP-dependent RNA helicase DeaD
MTNFANLGLPQELVEALERMQITVPTPVQAETIPVALNGQDVLASAQTGSGKTVAYSAPLLVKLADGKRGSALILTPTRELAVQVQKMLTQILGKNGDFRTALLIGGAPMFKQMSDLKRRPQLIIGTPGRINDHLQRGSLSLKETRFLVIDEADRMLDMGFGIQLDKIAEYLPEVRQTLMFSATFPSNIEKLSKKYLRDPQRITIGSTAETAPKIKQEVVRTTNSEKFSELLKQLEQREGSIIVFVKTKRGADRLARDLRNEDQDAEAIHGDLPQNRRDRVILAFRQKKYRVLVATDVAARGLDIPHVMHVINYNLPECPEDYIHRIGRTGRAGAEGSALCLVAPEDNLKWKAITRLMNPHAAQEERSEFSQRRPPQRFNQKKRPFKSFRPRSTWKQKGAK